MDSEKRVRAALDELGIDHEVMEVDPALSDTAAFVEAYGVPPGQTVNTILVGSRRGPPKLAACVLLASTRLDVNGAVRRAMGAPKVSFADPAQTLAETGMELGGVTPFALPDHVQILIDAAVMAAPDPVVIGGGSRAVKIRVSPSALSTLPGTVVEGLALPA